MCRPQPGHTAKAIHPDGHMTFFSAVLLFERQSIGIFEDCEGVSERNAIFQLVPSIFDLIPLKHGANMYIYMYMSSGVFLANETLEHASANESCSKSWLSFLHHLQPTMLLDRVEIPIIVQEWHVVLQRDGCNHAIDGFADGHAAFAEVAVYVRSPDER